MELRYNVMNINSLQAFISIKGGFANQCKDVYFVRGIGADVGLTAEIGKLDGTARGLMQGGRIMYSRVRHLPKLQAAEDIQFYSECYTQWLNSDKKQMKTRESARDDVLSGLLGSACTVILEAYGKVKKGVSASMEKNFLVKLAFWYDYVMKGLVNRFNPGDVIKIVADNVCSGQEYLFYYFLTQTGADVLLIQNEKDISDELGLLRLSASFKIGDMAGIPIPEYFPESAGIKPQQDACPDISVPEGAPGGNIKVRIPERRRKNREAGAAGMSSRGSACGAPGNAPRKPDGAPDMQPGNARNMQSGGAFNMHPGSAPNMRPAAPVEKSFEELALLASSVVMIAIHDRNGEIIGTGSGIMVGKGGYILTNNHVASGGQYYSVRIEEDDRIYPTDEVIKYNGVLDLAVIRIDRKLRPIPMYTGAKKLVRGQKVVAIGSPLGLFNSVSEGIISGFRTIDNVDMIQFTAPTSHGSSGGAVLNMQGEVIGISTAGFDNGQNINLAVGYECINAFVRGFI